MSAGAEEKLLESHWLIQCFVVFAFFFLLEVSFDLIYSPRTGVAGLLSPGRAGRRWPAHPSGAGLAKGSPSRPNLPSWALGVFLSLPTSEHWIVLILETSSSSSSPSNRCPHPLRGSLRHAPSLSPWGCLGGRGRFLTVLHPSFLLLLRYPCKIHVLIPSLNCSTVVSKVKQKLKPINEGLGVPIK